MTLSLQVLLSDNNSYVDGGNRLGFLKGCFPEIPSVVLSLLLREHLLLSTDVSVLRNLSGYGMN